MTRPPLGAVALSAAERKRNERARKAVAAERSAQVAEALPVDTREPPSSEPHAVVASLAVPDLELPAVPPRAVPRGLRDGSAPFKARDEVVDLTPPPPIGATLAACEELAALLKRQVDSAAVDPTAPWAARSSLASSYAKALRDVRVHRGEDELNETKIARSAPFRAMRARMLEILETRFPEALLALDDAYTAEDGKR